MTNDEYSKIRHKTPYIYKIKNGKQFLYYFGERHSFDPKHTQWPEQKKFWFDFVKKTEGQKRVAFVEAGRPSPKKTEEESISDAGGTGLVIFLATKQKMEICCPEPDRTFEMHELEKQFSREEIEYYYFARIVHQWGRIPEPKPKFEEYIVRFLERDKKESQWTNFDFSLDNMKIIHKKLFGKRFDLNDSDFFRDLVTPVELKTIINKVSRASGDVREGHIVNEIHKYWKNGYSIFIEYGASHAVRQEPLLKELLKQK
jgi:hypothetical protein